MDRSFGGLAQLGERGVRNAEVEGSNPLPSTMNSTRDDLGSSIAGAGPKSKNGRGVEPRPLVLAASRYGTLTLVLSPELDTVKVPADATGV